MPRWGARYVRFAANGFEAWIAIAAVLTAVRFFLDPSAVLDETPVGITFGPWDTIWTFGYLFGGLGILSGLWVGRGDFEVAGLMFMSGALLVQSIATAILLGGAAIVGVTLYLSVVTACLARAWLIVRYTANRVTEDP